MILLLLLPVYLVPLIVAAVRRSQSLAGIAMVNILLGWSLIGWVGALVWALVSHPASSERNPGGSTTPPSVCPTCRRRSERGTRFCRYCGEPLA